jgi:hypothetical protein
MSGLKTLILKRARVLALSFIASIMVVQLLTGIFFDAILDIIIFAILSVLWKSEGSEKKEQD